MSAETKAALDEALAAHINDESEDLNEGSMIVTGYALHASYVSGAMLERGAVRYFAEYGDQQAHHVSAGLVLHHATRLDYELRAGWGEDVG